MALAILGAVMTICAGILFAYASGTKVQGPVDHPSNVAFWWEGAWYTPAVRYTPNGGRFQSQLKYALVLIPAFVVGIGLWVFPGIRWHDSFARLWVLNTNPSDQPIRVRLDGKDLGMVPARKEGADFGNDSFMFRAGRHHVTVYTASDEILEESDFVTSPGHDELLASEATEHDICVGLITTIYSSRRSTSHPEPTPVRQVDHDVEEIPSPDHVWRPSPDTETVRDGESKTRIALRAMRCEPDAP